MEEKEEKERAVVHLRSISSGSQQLTTNGLWEAVWRLRWRQRHNEPTQDEWR